MTNDHKKGEPLKIFKRYYAKYRYDDEIKRQFLNYLYEEGPSSTTRIEYGIELNNRVMKRVLKDLLVASLVGIGNPENLIIPPEKRARLNDNVYTLVYITDLGNQCRCLMNDRNALLGVKQE